MVSLSIRWSWVAALGGSGLLVACSRPNPDYLAMAAAGSVSGGGSDSATIGGPSNPADGSGSLGTAEGSDGADSSSTGEPDGRRLCDEPWVSVEFTDPEPMVSINSPANDQDPSLSVNGQRLNFTRHNGGLAQAWTSRWDEELATFIAPGPDEDLAILPTPHGKVSYRHNFLEAILAVGGGAGFDLFHLQRGSVEDPFELPGESMSADLGLEPPLSDPHLSNDGERLYFTSGYDTLGRDIYVAERNDTGVFEQARLLGGVNSDSTHDASPTLTADELFIFFTSNRMDPEGDIHMAARSSIDEDFGEPVWLSELSTTEPDGHPQIDNEGCMLLFSSRRAGMPPAMGEHDIYVSHVEH